MESLFPWNSVVQDGSCLIIDEKIMMDSYSTPWGVQGDSVLQGTQKIWVSVGDS